MAARRTYAVLAFLVVLMALGSWGMTTMFSRSRESPLIGETKGPVPRVGSVNDRLDGIERRIAALGLQQQMLAARAVGASPTTGPQPSHSAADVPRQNGRDIGDGLRRAFETEPVDSSWSGFATEALRSHVTAIFTDAAGTGGGSTSRIEECECRSSICRVRVVHSDQASYKIFQDAFSGNPAHRLPGNVDSVSFIERQSSDGLVAIIYTGREGTPLPIFPE